MSECPICREPMLHEEEPRHAKRLCRIDKQVSQRHRRTVPFRIVGVLTAGSVAVGTPRWGSYCRLCRNWNTTLPKLLQLPAQPQLLVVSCCQEVLSALICGHVFHDDCIATYISASSNGYTRQNMPCPTCRVRGGMITIDDTQAVSDADDHLAGFITPPRRGRANRAEALCNIVTLRVCHTSLHETPATQQQCELAHLCVASAGFAAMSNQSRQVVSADGSAAVATESDPAS